MTIRSRFTKNSTNVRLFLSVLAGMLVTGCATVAPGPTVAAACPPERMQVCEAFGPQTRCACSDPSRIDRQLARLSLSAQEGIRDW